MLSAEYEGYNNLDLSTLVLIKIRPYIDSLNSAIMKIIIMTLLIEIETHLIANTNLPCGPLSSRVETSTKQCG